ncbi:two-component sensor histidine kinase [Paenibacillus oryzae]|uniref:Two-component sensor histidine kinase n=1 Tax=Paenibacillus oryzae TaxID=1844972 RepID=A0A1A5YKV9_9BACL|nr:histidine kinase [Paenibacillus oryzae]OBR66188.1 two-component sensor histidine kinase [Paenibacillus oryzae]
MFKLPAKALRNTIFVRLLTTYFFIILPIIFLGVYLYNWSYQNASDEISRNMKAQLTAYLDDLNREIEWMEIQQYDLLQDGDLNKMALMWDQMNSVTRKASLNDLLPRLVSIKNSSAFIKDVDVHVRSIDKTITAMTGINPFEADRYEEIVRVSARPNSRPFRIGDSLHLAAFKQGAKKGQEPLFAVTIELDEEMLKESLIQLGVYPESGSFLISELSGFTLADSDDNKQIMQSYMEGGRMNETSSLEVNGASYLIDQAYSNELKLSLVTYLPTDVVKRPLGKFYTWAWLFALMSLLAILIYVVSTYKFVHKPLLILVQSFRKMEGGTFDMQIQHKRSDEFGYLYDRFNHMLKRLQTLIDQDFKQKLMMQKAELKQLQSQINPHFLYNSFFILNSLAKTGDQERIELFTNMLGEYFRFITRNGEDNVKLSDEVRHSRMYTEIQKLRFSRRIAVEFQELPEELALVKVPRLIIQPIIENAYEHSLEKLPGEGLLRVSFEATSDEIRISVEDNGADITDDEIAELEKRLEDTDQSHEMTGLINIHRRIVLTYGKGSGLFLSRSCLNGLKVVIVITLTEENLHV